jgi:5,10-methylene-tetrahydrofolate dehydrogenase/methenyl tetrahydrofolate cyclohydrolase
MRETQQTGVFQQPVREYFRSGVKTDGVKKKAGPITPVPGGEGPITIAMLMMNTATAAKPAAGIRSYGE